MPTNTHTLLSSLPIFSLSLALALALAPSPDIGFSPTLAAKQATRLSTHSWEFGTAAEALLELYSPSLSVFSRAAFPGSRVPVVPVGSVPALTYVLPHIRTDNVTLVDGDGAAGDPCSLGVSAELAGATRPAYAAAAARQARHLLTAVPRWPNGAISHREAYAELWADFVYMAPPFLAYHAVVEGDVGALRFAAAQCRLYGEALRPPRRGRGDAVARGAWRHILGPPDEDLGLWSTGNAWAVMGMARVLATAMHWGPTGCEGELHRGLMDNMGGILRGAMTSVSDPASGLLRNYWNDSSWFGETSGTAMVTAAVYRLAVLQGEAREKGETCPKRYARALRGVRPVTPAMLAWADDRRQAVVWHVNGSAIAAPAVNPLGWVDSTPYLDGSPEGESFLVLLYAAWRDCIAAGICKRN